MVLFFVLFSLHLYAQDSNITHYQRRANLAKLVVPNTAYSSKDFIIHFPDSLYNAGKITIKRLKVSGLKLMCELNFKRNYYFQVKYTVKKSKKSKFETALMTALNVNDLSAERLAKLGLGLNNNLNHSIRYYIHVHRLKKRNQSLTYQFLLEIYLSYL